VKADQVDLGTVAYTIGINASILNTDYPIDTETYTYQQLIFGGPLSMVVDGSGDTLAYVLAQTLGNANNGTLDYNFPFTHGASGGYVQTSPPGTFDTPDPGTISLMAATQSGNQCSGDNTVGSTITLDPTQPIVVYTKILGCEGLAAISENSDLMTTTVTIPIGTVTSGNSTTTYVGEVTDFEWTGTGSVGPASPVPEPAYLWLCASGIALLGWRRFRRPSGKPAP
jgi:hypothetical protein